MIKPKKLSSLIGRVVKEDPKALLVYEGIGKVMKVSFFSSLAYTELKDTIDLPIISKGAISYRFHIKWDCSGIREPEDKPVTPYAFGDREDKQREMDSVKDQEEAGAELIGGRRHVGSGAIEGFKSDASSRIWQQEAKQTKALSMSIKLRWLDKIFREAREQDKEPMLHMRFLKIPDHMIVPEDWVLISAKSFKKLSD